MNYSEGVWTEEQIMGLNKTRDERLEAAIKADDGLWVKHTKVYWSRTVNGRRLQYWPSRDKWMYDGRMRDGDVYEFIRSNQTGVHP
jgi:hypothetical protein